MGWIWKQISYDDAGFSPARYVIVWSCLQCFISPWVVMILAGIWVYDGGLSRSSSYRGMYADPEFWFCALQCGLPSTCPVLYGVRHHFDLRLHQYSLHGDPSWKMSYSHPRVKERAALFCDGDRIWNVLMIDNILVLVRQLQLCIFDSTLGYPGEGPKWAMSLPQ